jgi:hypothetical protein
MPDARRATHEQTNTHTDTFAYYLFLLALSPPATRPGGQCGVPTRSARCSSSLHYSPVPAFAALGRGRATGVSHCRTLSNIVHVSTLCARHHREQPRVTNPSHATVTLTSSPHLRLILRRHFVQYYGRPLSSSLVELCSDCVAQFTASSGTTARFDHMISTKAHLRRQILCHVQYYVGQCYGQSCAQLSPALCLRRVRPLLHRTVLCHGFVRSYGYGPTLRMCPVIWLRRTTSSFTMVLWYDVTRSYVVTEVRRPVLRFYGSVVCAVLSYAWICGISGPILCLDLWYVWYVWSYPISGSMVCVVRSYVWCLDLRYVWSILRRPGLRSYGMRGPVLCRPRPASGFYVFRPITSDVGLRASVWSTQDHTRPPLGGVAPRQAEVPTGGTHTPVFDSTVRSGR